MRNSAFKKSSGSASPAAAFWAGLLMLTLGWIARGGAPRQSVPLNVNAQAIVSAASYSPNALAPGSIAAAFGSGFATATASASVTPLPLTLGGLTLQLTDSLGTARACPLFFVSPAQVNFQLPEGAAAGAASLKFMRADGALATVNITTNAVAPALFAADASGAGLPTAVVLRVKADGSQSFAAAARYDNVQAKFLAAPIEFGAATDQLFLLLFGSGIRLRSDTANVKATIGGVASEVLYAGPQGELIGLDQVNLRLPAVLANTGDQEIVLTVDGKAANRLKVSFASAVSESFSVTTGEAADGRNCNVIAACTTNVRFNQAQCGTVKSTDGTVWTVPAAVNEGAACTDIYNDCTGAGDDPNYLSKVKTTVIDEDGVEITGWFFGDNYFELYVNGKYVCRDSIGFIPFNSSVARFKVKYPITYAIRLVDWETHLGVGMEYDTFNVGDGGFIARFSDGTVTNGNWKTQVFYVAPLDNPSCIGANRNTSACAGRPACANSDPNKCQAVHYALPANWNSPYFDDSAWPTATLYTANQVTNQPAYTRYTQLFGNASFIWTRNLLTDNHVIARYTVPRAPGN